MGWKKPSSQINWHSIVNMAMLKKIMPQKESRKGLT